MKRPEGAAAKKAEPSPVVAPPPRIPVPSPLPAAKIAGTGSAPSSGAANAGNGTGAGGSGNGPGGGGSGDTSRFTPAQLVRNLSRGDYRSIAQGRLPAGRAMVSLRVEPDGVPAIAGWFVPAAIGCRQRPLPADRSPAAVQARTRRPGTTDPLPAAICRDVAPLAARAGPALVVAPPLSATRALSRP